MAQASYDIQGTDGVKNTLKTVIDSFFEAVLTKNSGNTEPLIKKPFMWWADTTTGLLKRRNAANDNWLVIARLDDVGGLRTNAGNPNGAVTGSYQGERLCDTTNNVEYRYSGSGTVWYPQQSSTNALLALPGNYQHWDIRSPSTTTLTIKGGSQWRSADNAKDVIFGSDYTIDITNAAPSSTTGGRSVARSASTPYYVYVGLNSSGAPLAWIDTADLSNGGAPTNPAAYSSGRAQVLGRSGIPLLIYLNSTGSGEIELFVVQGNNYLYLTQQTIVSGGTSTSVTQVAPSGRIPALARQVLAMVETGVGAARAARVLTFRNSGGAGSSQIGTTYADGTTAIHSFPFLREIESGANGFYYQIVHVAGSGTPSINAGYWGYVL